MKNRLLSKKDTADALAVSVRTVERLIEREVLVPVRIGGRVAFLESEIEEYIEELIEEREAREMEHGPDSMVYQKV